MSRLTTFDADGNEVKVGDVTAGRRRIVGMFLDLGFTVVYSKAELERRIGEGEFGDSLETTKTFFRDHVKDIEDLLKILKFIDQLDWKSL